MTYLVKPADLAPPVSRQLPPDPSLPRTCVIGAGPSGIAAAKALSEARIPFDCFEMGPVVGGNWVFDNPNGVSACYRQLEINTSCPRMAYSDFPMPSYYPAYARHWEIRDYFERYVDHFGFRQFITFDTKVERVTADPGGGWQVTIAGGENGTRHYDAVLVCNGHHWNPRWPEPAYPGSFAGDQMHAHDYREQGQLEGKQVIIVGMGNSAMDIAVEASYVAAQTTVSVRRGQWILRKTLRGRPVDQRSPPAWAPWALKRKAYALLAGWSGDLGKAGLPRPDHAPGESHPVQSDRFYDRVMDGRIAIKPAIERLTATGINFADGSHLDADLIVWCTGYQVSFPFFDPALIAAPGNELPLWKRTVRPGLPGLFFIGLLQPLGAVMPLAEAQSRWVASWLAGHYTPPADEAMRASMIAEHEQMKKRFYASARHTMEVDFDAYLVDLRREHDRGVARRRERVA